MLTYSTAGESHGKSLLAMVDGFPAGLQIDEAFINNELRLRQGGYGRGGRQKLEQDQVNILSGVWQGVTLGSPIAMQIVNNDYKLERLKELERPRPGHADLTGAIKYLGSIRGVLERSSARETAARVAAGALARLLLREFGIETVGYVVELGQMQFGAQGTEALSIAEVRVRRDQSSLYSVQPHTDPDAQAYIDRMADQGDTLGGIV
jgi:chorismate synthase